VTLLAPPCSTRRRPTVTTEAGATCSTRLAADRPDTAGHQPNPDHITT